MVGCVGYDGMVIARLETDETAFDEAIYPSRMRLVDAGKRIIAYLDKETPGLDKSDSVAYRKNVDFLVGQILYNITFDRKSHLLLMASWCLSDSGKDELIKYARKLRAVEADCAEYEAGEAAA